MSKTCISLVATSMLFAAVCAAPSALAADAAADGSKLNTALTPLSQLLDLMDTDKNGKVSKEEFMKFMETEFNYADKNKDGELDPVELKALVYRMNHPYRSVPRVGK